MKQSVKAFLQTSRPYVAWGIRWGLWGFFLVMLGQPFTREGFGFSLLLYALLIPSMAFSYWLVGYLISERCNA